MSLTQIVEWLLGADVLINHIKRTSGSAFSHMRIWRSGRCLLMAHYCRPATESKVRYGLYSVEKLQFRARPTNFFTVQSDQKIMARGRPISTSGAAGHASHVWPAILSDFRRSCVFPENRDIQISEFFNRIGSKRQFAAF